MSSAAPTPVPEAADKPESEDEEKRKQKEKERRKLKKQKKKLKEKDEKKQQQSSALPSVAVPTFTRVLNTHSYALVDTRTVNVVGKDVNALAAPASQSSEPKSEAEQDTKSAPPPVSIVPRVPAPSSYIFTPSGRKVVRHITRMTVNTPYVIADSNHTASTLIDKKQVQRSGIKKRLADDKKSTSTMPSAPGYTVLQSACLSCDLDFAIAARRMGAKINERAVTPRRETPLLLAVYNSIVWKEREQDQSKKDHQTRRSQKDEEDRRDRQLSVIGWLCDIGVDVNLTEEQEGRTALHVAAQTGDLQICDILLRYGADATILDLEKKTAGQLISDPTQQAEFAALVSHNTALVAASGRPPVRCWCTSGKLHSECHGLGDNRHSDWPTVAGHYDCPCRSSEQLPYERCCLKKDITFKENDTSTIKQIKGISPNFLPKMRTYLDLLRQRLKDPILPANALFYPLRAARIGKSGDIARIMRDATQDFVRPLVESKSVDPAFAYALANCDFFPQLWSHLLDAEECTKRQTEWNSSIDKYISNAKQHGDRRPEIEICRSSKIGLSGGAMLRPCATASCKKYEAKEGDHSACSVCKGVSFCSKECQKAHWPTHKPLCRKPPSSVVRGTYLPSQITLSAAINQLAQTLSASGSSSSSTSENPRPNLPSLSELASLLEQVKSSNLGNNAPLTSPPSQSAAAVVEEE